MPVSLLKVVVGCFLLLAWLPATSLCLIERAGWFANDDCCASSAAKPTPSNDSTCCKLASATYKAEEYSPLHTNPARVIWVLVFEKLAVETEPVLVNGHTDDVGPPALLKTWQFVFRTALPARAPSLV